MKGPDGATAAPYAFSGNRDAIVYEAGVRDLTVDPTLTGFSANHAWGTFKGLVDLLPHIQKLGVTHIQLLCPLENYYYDQTKNRQRELDTAQTAGANYNWGYDPQNYFTPSGMYSASPADPAARVNELKTLVNEIHKQGMGVILDVVYNHTANNSVLADPGLQGYYYRSSSKNGAGSNVPSKAIIIKIFFIFLCSFVYPIKLAFCLSSIMTERSFSFFRCRFLSSMRNIIQYPIGIIVMMKSMAIKVPKQTTTPIGPHIGEFWMTIGMTPIEAAALVRNIGRIRRWAACRAACLALR
jgi:hypothetical protein